MSIKLLPVEAQIAFYHLGSNSASHVPWQPDVNMLCSLTPARFQYLAFIGTSMLPSVVQTTSALAIKIFEAQ
jgi:hypothetical protein